MGKSVCKRITSEYFLVNKGKIRELLLAWWDNSKRTKENRLGFCFPFFPLGRPAYMFIYRNQILQKKATSYCLLQTKMETAIFCLFAGNRNEKLKFVFLGRQTINDDCCFRKGAHLWFCNLRNLPTKFEMHSKKIFCENWTDCLMIIQMDADPDTDTCDRAQGFTSFQSFTKCLILYGTWFFR